MRDSSYIIFYVVDSDDPERLVAMFDGFIGRLPECFAEGDEEYWEGNEYFNRMAAFGLGVNGYYLMVDRRWLGHGLGKLLAEAFTRFDYGPEYSYLFADLAVPGVPRVRKIFVENLDYQPSRFCVDDTSGNEWRIFVKARDGRRLITDNDGWAIGTAPAI